MGVIVRNTKNLVTIQSVIVGDVRSRNSIPCTGGEVPIKVVGTYGATYKIKVEKKTSFTGSETHASGYYNWDRHAFTASTATGTYSQSGVITKGSNTHYVMFPTSTSDVRYEVYILAADGTTLSINNDLVPTKAGDLTITQYGTRTLSLATQTNAAADYGALPSAVTIEKPKRYPGDTYVSKPLQPVYIQGGTSGSSSTRLVLNKQADDITPNMLITGAGVTHGATVKSVKRNIVTLSTACTIANNTTLRFDLNNNRLTPFSFTVTPAAGHTIAKTANVDFKTKVGGFAGDITLKTNGTTSNSTSLTVDSTRGVTRGMVVGSIGTTYTRGTYDDEVTVTVIDDNGTGLTLSHAISTGNDVEFKVSEKITSTGGVPQDPKSNKNCKIIHMDLDDSTANIVITGYIDAQTIDATMEHPIYLDDIITVTQP